MFWRQPPCQRRLVIVNLKDDPATAIKGALWSTSGPWLVLRGASHLREVTGSATETVKAEPIDGEAIVHTSNVRFLQVLP